MTYSVSITKHKTRCALVHGCAPGTCTSGWYAEYEYESTSSSLLILVLVRLSCVLLYNNCHINTADAAAAAADVRR